jgi:hypothetical protein
MPPSAAKLRVRVHRDHLVVKAVESTFGLDRSRRVTQVLAQLCAQGPLNERLLERHGRDRDRLRAHRPVDELVDQLGGEWWAMLASPASVCLAYMLMVVMLCPEHKISDSPSLRSTHVNRSFTLGP